MSGCASLLQPTTTENGVDSARMDTNRLLAALCYFSIFFAGFIVPIAVFIVSNDPYVRRHAKGAFFSHALPFVLLFTAMLAFWLSPTNVDPFTGLLLLSGIAYVAVMIYNVVQGIRVLIK